MTEHLWLLPLIPLFGSAVNGLYGRRLARPMVSLIACGAAVASFVLALSAFFDLLRLAPADRLVRQIYFTWIESGDFIARAEFLFDPLSAVMILIVTGVGLIIHVYATAYMREEPGYSRFFAYMNLFLFSMLVLVLAGDFLLMFVGWEGVGLCSYLLIGFHYTRPSAADAGKKAFIVNRIGDVGFLLGLFLVFLTFQSLSFSSVFNRIVSDGRLAAPESGVGILTAIGLLLFVGATGKSAQIPLYVWLPDAMEGPTPVSALIHAATMVTAGVYMVVRCAPIYSRAPITMDTVLTVGMLTALVAATIALVQTDIKRVLAYSTVSQLGYMFAAAGAGAFSAGIFHLMTHAFFKALLFLGAGSVIHALAGEQDLRRMGNLRSATPITFWTMLIAALAIGGIFPFSGFFSKDEILWSVWAGGHPVAWTAGLATAALTAFYMFRLIFLAFFGKAHHSDPVRGHIHESPPGMTVPLLILAALAAAGGFIGLPAWLGDNRFARFLEPSLTMAIRPEPHAFSHAVEIGFAALALIAALAGIFLAHRFYIVRPAVPARLAERWSAMYRLLAGKYFVDEFYHRILVRPLVQASTRLLWKRIDAGLIDGAVNSVGRTIDSASGTLKGMHNGLIRSYAAWILLGVVAALAYITLSGS